MQIKLVEKNMSNMHQNACLLSKFRCSELQFISAQPSLVLLYCSKRKTDQQYDVRKKCQNINLAYLTFLQSGQSQESVVNMEVNSKKIKSLMKYL